jgi:PKD repeat protein
VSYVWTFVDGTEQELTGEVVEYVFENEGEFEVNLTVADAAGNEDTDTVVVRVGAANDPPSADAGGPVIIVEAGDTVQFDGTDSTDDSGVIDSYTWTFEYDGELVTLTGAEPEFKFEIAGTYVVTLNVTDEDGLWDEATVTVVVEEKASTFLTDYWWLLAAVAAVVVIAALVALLRPGKGGQPKSGESSDEELDFDEDEPPPPDDDL